MKRQRDPPTLILCRYCVCLLICKFVVITQTWITCSLLVQLRGLLMDYAVLNWSFYIVFCETLTIVKTCWSEVALYQCISFRARD